MKIFFQHQWLELLAEIHAAMIKTSILLNQFGIVYCRQLFSLFQALFASLRFIHAELYPFTRLRFRAIYWVDKQVFRIILLQVEKLKVIINSIVGLVKSSVRDDCFRTGERKEATNVISTWVHYSSAVPYLQWLTFTFMLNGAIIWCDVCSFSSFAGSKDRIFANVRPLWVPSHFQNSFSTEQLECNCFLDELCAFSSKFGKQQESLSLGDFRPGEKLMTFVNINRCITWMSNETKWIRSPRTTFL